MEKFKTKLSYDLTTGLMRLLQHVITESQPADTDDMLHIAALAEVLAVINKKLLEYKNKYSLSLTRVQALAMRKLYTDYIMNEVDATNYLANYLLKLSNHIHQQYQSL